MKLPRSSHSAGYPRRTLITKHASLEMSHQSALNAGRYPLCVIRMNEDSPQASPLGRMLAPPTRIAGLIAGRCGWRTNTMQDPSAIIIIRAKSLR